MKELIWATIVCVYMLAGIGAGFGLLWLVGELIP